MLHALVLSLTFAVQNPMNAAPVPVEFGTDYTVTNDTVSDSTGFNVEVSRGLSFDAGANVLWAINAYESSLKRFDLGSVAATGVTEPHGSTRTLTEPVAVHEHGAFVYVLGQGSHALARHEKATGRLVETVKLPSEPADFVIDASADRAFVSCMGSDSIVEVDLRANKMDVLRSWIANRGGIQGFLMKRPRFLTWDDANSKLYVAPFLSGNNSMVLAEHDAQGDLKRQGIVGTDEITQLPSGAILDGYDAASFPQGGLPDVDLFVISPDNGPNGSVEQVARRAGTLLTGHGIHPNGDYWMVSVDASNVNPQTEPEAKGDFARNVLAILPQADLQNPGQNPLSQPAIVDLDFDTAVPGYDAGHSLPFPYAIEFGVGTQNWTAITSSTLGRVHLVDSSGARVHRLELVATGNLPAGEVARDLAYFGTDLYIYCQQTGNVLVWEVTGATTPPSSPARVLSLGNDPTPAAIAAGRGHFYDARRSETSRFTCATCHPGAESDLLSWNLEEGVQDFKDPMVTQPLKGLQESFPFHWRGERGLHDFNEAFPGLLGAPTALSDSEFEEFEAFIFSLRPAANPLSLITRQLPANTTRPYGAPGAVRQADPGNGQSLFLGSTCNSCHFLPTAGNGSVVSDNGVSHHRGNVWNRRMETIQLSNFLQGRLQPLVRVRAANGTDVARPLLGSGHRHSGVMPTLFHFIETVFGIVFSDVQDQADLASFFLHLDTGTPPSAHHVIDVDPGQGSLARVDRELVTQAKRGWIDVIVIGRAPDDSGTPRDLHWLYNPITNRFHSDDPINAGLSRPLSWFFNFNGVGAIKDNTFLGVLPGQGQRLAHDFDYDGLINGEEGPTHGTNPWDADGDDDTFADGYEVANGQSPTVPDASISDSQQPNLAPGTSVVVKYVNAAQARLEFETDEPCRWEIRTIGYRLTWPGTGLFKIDSEGPEFARKHSAEIHGLMPSTSLNEQPYVAFITITDQNGNSRALDRVFFSARRGDGLNASWIIGKLELTGETWTPSTAGSPPYSYSASMQVRVDDQTTTSIGPKGDVRVIAQLLERDPTGETWVPIPLNRITVHTPGVATDFRVQGLVYGDELSAGGFGGVSDGPFLVLNRTSATQKPGTSVVRFTVDGLDEFREEVQVNLVGIGGSEVAGSTTALPDFSGGPFFNWNMPKTLPELRRVTSTP